MTTNDKPNLPARFADVAMYTAQPIPDTGPGVVLVSMTENPLRVMAAASELYRGGICPDPRMISEKKALEWLDGFKSSKISAPLEFISLHFFIQGVTRAFTHQLVRQRTAVFVQESMRFAVKEDASYEVAMPPSIEDLPIHDHRRIKWGEAVEYIGEAYNYLIDTGIPAEDARGLLPTNITTRIHYHTDLRNLVNQAGMRLCSQAQAEWKAVWAQMIKAIINYGPHSERWQQIEIGRLFKPICYQTGSCGFNGPADRWCVIRDRVNAHAAAGDPPDTWTDVDPREPLHHKAARKPQ